jgi:hypothetical protein
MQKLIFVSILALLAGWSDAAQKGPASSPQELIEAKKCLQPWLDGLDLIIKKLPTDSNLRNIRDFVANGAIAKPIVLKGGRGQQYLSAAPDSTKGWVGILPICSEAELPFVWREHLDNSPFMAMYEGENNTVVLRASFTAPNLLRGLVLIHEMRHMLQGQRPIASEAAPGYLQLREIDAYEYEFGFMDRLNLPGYKQFLDDEVARIKKEYRETGGATANWKDARLEKLFPDLGIQIKPREVAATEMFVRAHFALYDRENTEKVAFQKKMAFMASIGYR